MYALILECGIIVAGCNLKMIIIKNFPLEIFIHLYSTANTHVYVVS